jgi:hypothetical protein
LSGLSVPLRTKFLAAKRLLETPAERKLNASCIGQGYCFNAGEWSFPDAPLRGVCGLLPQEIALRPANLQVEVRMAISSWRFTNRDLTDPTGSRRSGFSFFKMSAEGEVEPITICNANEEAHALSCPQISSFRRWIAL